MPDKLSSDILGPTSDYTRVAQVYDRTRNVPGDVLRDCFLRACAAGLLPAAGLILDAGCGTGQASQPLPGLGFEVRGYDATPAMVAIATAKCKGTNARYLVADVRRLPEPDRTFDGAVAAKLFQHVGDWRLGVCEIVRVLKPGACVFVLDERGPKNPVREAFAQRLKHAGVSPHLPGSRDAREIAAAFVEEGCRSEPFDAAGLTWNVEFRFGDALAQLRDRLSAEFWSVPDAEYQRALAAAAAAVNAQPQGEKTMAVIEPHLSVAVFRCPTAPHRPRRQASPGR
jgi:ubiquinone/menaquinone biosynthesis C-methylase UbiE